MILRFISSEFTIHYYYFKRGDQPIDQTLPVKITNIACNNNGESAMTEKKGADLTSTAMCLIIIFVYISALIHQTMQNFRE